MYRVIVPFFDVVEEVAYNIGDDFPAEGKKATKKRLEELSSEKNAAGVPLIEKVAPAK